LDEKQKDCPSCRIPVVEVKKNAMVNSLVERYLKVNPQLKRDEEEIK